jgi:gas vesicle protein
MKSSLIFLLGLGMGTVLGILIAPDAGRVTRRRIRDEADKIVDRAMAKKRLKETAAEAVPDVVVVTEERYTI